MTPTQRIELQKLVRAARSPQQTVLRARIVLRADDGEDNTTIARTLRIGANTVAKWRGRFAEEGLVGLADTARSGRPARLDQSAVERVLTEVTRPPKGRARWSVRSMARHAGLSKSAVQQLWARNALKPHRTRTFKISRDPLFEPKFWDVIGLYLEPPQKALVLCCDEKSQCQALERTQPGLPLGVGHIRTRTHDYTRHGTVTLFAALNYLEGKILHLSAPRHRHQEGLGFLRHLDAETPPDLDLHLRVGVLRGRDRGRREELPAIQPQLRAQLAGAFASHVLVLGGAGANVRAVDAHAAQLEQLHLLRQCAHFDKPNAPVAAAKFLRRKLQMVSCPGCSSAHRERTATSR